MFKFELNSVLSLKGKVEDNKKRELGLANKCKEELEVQKVNLTSEKHTLLNEIKANSFMDVDINRIKMLNRYSSHVTKQIKQKQADIHQAQQIVEKKREELLEAMKERKILDNLKEIKLEQYINESKKVEQILVDEIVSYRYGELRRSEGENG